MLILSRGIDESIVIGDAVRITVLSLKGGQVRIGIDAPDSVKILRGELVDSDRPSRVERDQPPSREAKA